MNFRLPVLTLALALGAAACNPVGTCVSEREHGDLGAQCTVNHTKKACAMPGEGIDKFYAEDRAAGMLRCKSLGYERAPGARSNPDPSAPIVLFKKSPKKK